MEVSGIKPRLVYKRGKNTITHLIPYITADMMYINKFNVHGSVHRKNILIYIQQDATLHSLFYLETALHVSGGTTIHHQEGK